MTTKLNGWVRIGIVLSVLWSLFVVAWLVSELTSGGTDVFFTQVVTKTGEIVTPELRSNSFYDLIPTHRAFRFPAFAAVMFLPLLVGWAVVLTVVQTLRWIGAGFTKRSHDDAAS